MQRLFATLSSLLLATLTLSACSQNGVAADRPINVAEIDKPLQILTERFTDDWLRFRQRYVTDAGRVIDTGNGGVSHSEGQGYGMLFAVAADDRDTFNLLRRWTQDLLQRDDGLHYWRYDPSKKPSIGDPNSAADGELLIAWALLRASARWQDASCLIDARRIIRTFEDRLIRRIGKRLVIIPWDGADLDSPRVINPSYFVFPAMQEIAAAVGSELWVELYEDSLDLLADSRFGVRKLPPDWLAIDDDNELSIWRERNPYFSYDAIRIPLHLVWAGHDSAKFVESYLDAWADFPIQRTPAWFNLLPGSRTHARDAGPSGFQAVRALTTNIHAVAHQDTTDRISVPNLYSAQDYYSASLILLSRLAEVDWWQATAEAAHQVR